MNEKKRLPRSIRKYIREQKAKIRKTVADPKEQKQYIEALYSSAKN